jgi:hypothetical protein
MIAKRILFETIKYNSTVDIPPIKIHMESPKKSNNWVLSSRGR